ncbi:hypothetical protein [Lentibacter sp. XHP0401]|jgi:hypothetical protein|uniref:hypothetical protein n=1 Tax=Lentibacter sp. XHP0401 TaxID=2984334 RepID=UPI0021E7C8B7|nr:hypothetical protein [Lentibacter sp. XHP0401]MCV2892650.1 hypothetical protein [Lentibacter sp. XHP0401]
MIERICTKRMFALLLGCAAILTSLPAYADSCTTRDVMVERLQNTYQEELTGGGLHGASAVVEVWVSVETGTFTVISTNTAGEACILATGTDWQGPLALTKVSGISS